MFKLTLATVAIKAFPMPLPVVQAEMTEFCILAKTLQLLD